MSAAKETGSEARLDRVVAEARRARDERALGYRDRALKMYPWVCGRCGREFTHANLRLLEVHHRDHNHDNNPEDGSNWEIFSSPDKLHQVVERLKAAHIAPAAAEVSMIPQNYVKLEGKAAQQMVKLMEVLEEHDDVQHVWSNFDISEKEIEASLA